VYRVALCVLALTLSCASEEEQTPPARPPALALSSSSAAPASAPPVADDPAPTLRLPTDVKPLAEALELHLDPRQDRFSGAVDIDLELSQPRSVVWLHGRDLHVSAAALTPAGGSAIPATWTQVDESGIASVKPARPLSPGKARLHLEFDAPFATGQKGLYKATEAGTPYAYTQFEATAARMAFPCFDEPSFKIPYATTLVVPADDQAVANAHEVGRSPQGASLRVSFAPTLPLPSYLVAFAVGPLDVTPEVAAPPNEVRKAPLAIRGVTPRGRAKEIAYALAHTGEILAVLEKYTGVAYPYDKLDILAVPGKGGAMENPGAVTFGERLLLMDEKTAPVAQKRAYAGVMAHELAHQWTGDLVTMQWWDDTWLNEAFATWLGNKAADLWNPDVHAQMTLLGGMQGAMSADSLVSARAIRQPIRSPHDIENAFDSITYQKGGGVLAMFERWAGPEAWQKGLHAYLEAHRFGNATADDFLEAENAATGRDVKTAFHTFLDQPGVPFVEASVSCPDPASRKLDVLPDAVVHLKQSRYLPLGSSGDASRTWELPVCLRAEGIAAPVCTQLKGVEGSISLAGGKCPAWVFPNADGAGYFRFALAPKDLANLRAKGLGSLTAREKVAYGTSVQAAFARGAISYGDAVQAVAPLATDPDPAVASAPMGYLSTARDWLFTGKERGTVESYARQLYAPVARKLGWTPRPGEDDEVRTLRARVLTFLAFTAQDPAVRAEAKRRGLAYVKDGGLHEDAVDPNLAPIAVGVLGEEGDRAVWEAIHQQLLASVDETVRGRLLFGLSSAKDPGLTAATRDLVLGGALRDSEILSPLGVALGDPSRRDAAWSWLKENYDAILTRLPRHHGGVALVGAGAVYCDEEHARDLEAFFTPKIQAIEGGPRVLATTLEEMRLCAARRKVQEPSARAFFAKPAAQAATRR
jgi:alanyl aminopeptidase